MKTLTHDSKAPTYKTSKGILERRIFYGDDLEHADTAHPGGCFKWEGGSGLPSDFKGYHGWDEIGLLETSLPE